MYVTFVDELASLDPSVVSMVGTVQPDDPTRRTYQVVRKPADGLAYAVTLAEKYGLTYETLSRKERVMKAHLLHPDHDVDLTQPLPANAGVLLQDLELDRLLDAMAGGDPFLRDVAVRTLLCSLEGRDTIIYRQHVLWDCLHHPDVIRPLYDVIVQSLREARKTWTGTSPDSVLSGSVNLLAHFMATLTTLHGVAYEQGPAISIPRPHRLLRDAPDRARRHLPPPARRAPDAAALPERSADERLAREGQRRHPVRPPDRSTPAVVMAATRSTPGRLHLPAGPRDEAGSQIVGKMRARGIALVATAVAEAAEHVRSFLQHVQTELAFYVGCLNLHHALASVWPSTSSAESGAPRTSGTASDSRP